MKRLNDFLNKNLIAILGALIFLFFGVFTIQDYGTSWDETIHYSRGNVYLNYFLTGSKEYKEGEKRSFFALEYQDGDFFFKNNPGHPPINDILASLFNKILYIKLSILDDIESYHIFILLISAVLVFITTKFAKDTIGNFGALITLLSLITYPLFFVEAHFNIKDPIEAAFFTGAIWSFYNSLRKQSIIWLIGFYFFLGLGLGTKFNILFTPFIIIPYLLLRFKDKVITFKKWQIKRSYIIVLFLGPLVSLGIFVGSWPYLWNNFPTSLFEVFRYYEHIGTQTNYQPENFYIFGFNLFPTLWIIFTTPPIVLFLSFVGIIYAIKKRNFGNGVFVLWLLWFAVPIIRVSLPGASIYGGDRQIMEFLPALCLLAGLGGLEIIKFSSKLFNIKNILFLKLALILLFLWPAFILVKIHPNQNVYFNFIIGGLKGAEKRNFPSWGNSYGNAYFQGIKWLNKNAPLNSKVSLIQGTPTNAPSILFRNDISLNPKNWSGLKKDGEYLMELNFNDTGKAYYYTWEYVEKMLNPVYEVKVDGVPILKIWKNDEEHTKKKYRNLTEKEYSDYKRFYVKDHVLNIELVRVVRLSKLILLFSDSETCSKIQSVIVESSQNGKNWYREKDTFPFPQVGIQSNLDANKLTIFFADRNAKEIRLLFESDKSCGLQDPAINVYTF